MRKPLHVFVVFLPVFLICCNAIAQTLPDLGTSKRYVIFGSAGLITNTGTSFFKGDVGTDAGVTAGFGNFDGNIESANPASQQAAADLGAAIAQMNSQGCTTNILSMTVSNTTYRKGVYCVSLNATLSDSITLDAENDPNAVFIFNVTGFLTIMPGTRMILANGAQACRVFWNVSGMVSAGAGSIVKGNIIGSSPALNAINLDMGTTLEGRVLATTGAVTLTSVSAKIPAGCGLPASTGPVSPNLRSANCYALFSAAGNLSNTGTTTVQGRIGTNAGTVTGYQAGNISQGIYMQDAGTQQVAADLELAYTYINGLPYDVDLAFPLLFGNKLTLTPHVYRLNSNTILTDTLFIDAQDNPNSIFIIKVNGNFTATANAKVVLMNGAKSCNIYWQVSGLLNLNANTGFVGNAISNNNITSGTGSTLDGRLFTRSGDVAVNTLSAAIPVECGGCPYSPVNNPPYPADDGITLQEDAGLYPIRVLNNDSDPDLDSLIVSIITTAKHGTTTTNGVTISYKVNADYTGRDTIIYRVCDNRTPALCASAIVRINVMPVNDKPVAADDYAYTQVNVPVSIPVTANDRDVEGQPLSVSIINPPNNGAAIAFSDSIFYTPGPGFIGYDTLYYQVCDNDLPNLCDTAMVVIQVTLTAPNFAPVANADRVFLCENSDSNFIDVQANDTDANADSLTTTIVGGPHSGTASISNNELMYTPGQNFSGYDTIVYRVCDSTLCDTSIVYIRVYAAPVANAGPDRTIVFGDSVMIGSAPAAGSLYAWDPRDNLDAAFEADPYASPDATTRYTVMRMDTATGCRSQDEVLVTVSGDGFYNGLSPNNDGQNDYWKIPALNKYPKNYVTVINRYGSEVWKAADYDNNNVRFAGNNLNGEALPDGTYFYVINYNNTKKEGWVIIKR